MAENTTKTTNAPQKTMAGGIAQHIDQLKPHVKRFDEWLSQFPAFVGLERVTNIPKVRTLDQ
ncbi:hypothetical protein HK097_010357 [Rhizophlyctis rosea]|uniref:Uncharacterized protein n=1 Tax=Rhizophlyctis rosea TaxID=64517 RepID=A0AAD5S7P1_9FUNG|nr:hypothetical protein HK097_010357 [Rhizophlyctis rosea]